MEKFSDYWKDNQNDKFASDYPMWKRLQKAHQEELKNWKDYYNEEINKRDVLIAKLNERVSELTQELERKDNEIQLLQEALEEVKEGIF